MTREFEIEGSNVRYDVHGEAGVPLVHGWACQRADWEAVISHLGNRRVVAVDLPWHGESTGGREAWDLGAFAEVIAELVHHEHLEAPIFVGHSMGGAVCVEAAGRLGSTVSRVVSIDALTYLAVYPRQNDESVRATGDALRTDFAGVVRAMVESLFVDRDRPELIETVVAEMTGIPEGQASPPSKASCAGTSTPRCPGFRSPSPPSQPGRCSPPRRWSATVTGWRSCR
jgi:pimeloyl-ACP methyl ester carboxylesterase